MTKCIFNALAFLFFTGDTSKTGRFFKPLHNCLLESQHRSRDKAHQPGLGCRKPIKPQTQKASRIFSNQNTRRFFSVDSDWTKFDQLFVSKALVASCNPTQDFTRREAICAKRGGRHLKHIVVIFSSDHFFHTYNIILMLKIGIKQRTIMHSMYTKGQ